MTNTILLEWKYDFPPEIIWQSLTESEKLSQWLMENDFKPVVGHRFRFLTKPKIKVGFDGIIYCEVLKVEPVSKLSYSWKGGPGDGRITLDSIVTWTLVPEGNGTLLKLEHAGFEGMRNLLSFIMMRVGWQKIMRKKLMHVLNYVEL